MKTPVSSYGDVSLLVRLQDFLFEHKSFLTRLAIALAVILFAAASGFLLSRENPILGFLLPAIPLGAAGVFLLEKRLYLGPVLILLAAGYLPFYLPTGTGSVLVDSLVLAVGVGGLWILRMLVVTRRREIAPSPVNLPVFGFMVTSVIAFVWSQVFRDPGMQISRSFLFVQVASTLIMVISPFLLLFVGNTVRELRWMKVMVALMIGVGVLGMVNELVVRVFPVNFFGLAAMWAVAFAVALILVAREVPVVWKALLAVMALAILYTQFVRYLSWISGWLPGMVALVVILWFRSKRLFLAAVVVVTLFVLIDYARFEANFATESLESGDTRLAAWLVNWEFTRQHILFGMGPGGYASYYMTYIPTNAMATHSNYIDIFSGTGIIGIGFYFAIFVTLGWRGLVVYRRVRGRRDFTEALALATLGGWAGCVVIMAFGDWLIPFAYTQTIAGFDHSVYNWLFLGLILSLDFVTRPQPNGAAQ